MPTSFNILTSLYTYYILLTKYQFDAEVIHFTVVSNFHLKSHPAYKISIYECS